jgi:hypothetical protein
LRTNLTWRTGGAQPTLSASTGEPLSNVHLFIPDPLASDENATKPSKVTGQRASMSQHFMDFCPESTCPQLDAHFCAEAVAIHGQ